MLLIYQLAPDWDDTTDLAQEVFIRVWRSINNLRNPASFRSWLTQIVTNLFYDELRKRPRKLPTVSMDDSSTDEDGENPTRDIPDSSAMPEEKALNKEVSVCNSAGNVEIAGTVSDGHRPEGGGRAELRRNCSHNSNRNGDSQVPHCACED